MSGSWSPAQALASAQRADRAKPLSHTDEPRMVECIDLTDEVSTQPPAASAAASQPTPAPSSAPPHPARSALPTGRASLSSLRGTLASGLRARQQDGRPSLDASQEAKRRRIQAPLTAGAALRLAGQQPNQPLQPSIQANSAAPSQVGLTQASSAGVATACPGLPADRTAAAQAPLRPSASPAAAGRVHLALQMHRATTGNGQGPRLPVAHRPRPARPSAAAGTTRGRAAGCSRQGLGPTQQQQQQQQQAVPASAAGQVSSAGKPQSGPQFSSCPPSEVRSAYDCLLRLQLRFKLYGLSCCALRVMLLTQLGALLKE